jgi:TPR repeat protein
VKSHCPTSHSGRARKDDLFQRANQLWERGELRPAFRLFLVGAKSGDSGCQINLGYFYDRGLGVKPSRSRALYWYKRAYRHGASVAATNIGTIWRDEHKKKRALYWFERAAELNDSEANLEIAKLYLAEKTGARKAISHLKKVCRSDDVTRSGAAEARRLLRLVLPRKGQSSCILRVDESSIRKSRVSRANAANFRT